MKIKYLLLTECSGNWGYFALNLVHLEKWTIVFSIVFYSNDSTNTKTNIKPPKTNTNPRTKKKGKKEGRKKNKNKRPMDHNAHQNNNGHAKPALKSRIQNIWTME